MSRRNTKLPLILLLLIAIVSIVCCIGCQAPKGCPTCVGGTKPAYYNKERVKAAKRMALSDKRRSATGEKRMKDQTSESKDSESKQDQRPKPGKKPVL